MSHVSIGLPSHCVSTDATLPPPRNQSSFSTLSAKLPPGAWSAQVQMRMGHLPMSAQWISAQHGPKHRVRRSSPSGGMGTQITQADVSQRVPAASRAPIALSRESDFPVSILSLLFDRGYSIPAPHAGFANVAWWNTTLWNTLRLSDVDCNPARCVSTHSGHLLLTCFPTGYNAPSCFIPNCTLINHDSFYLYGAHSMLCLSVDCIPEADRTSWPDGETDEGAACKGALNQESTGVYRTAMVQFCLCPSPGFHTLSQGWYLHPATRMIFCTKGGYSTMFTEFVPRCKAPP